MNPARQAFEDELRELIVNSRGDIISTKILIKNYADRLLELARRVINEE